MGADYVFCIQVRKDQTRCESLSRHESHEAKRNAIGGGSDGPVVWQLGSTGI
jgi:hypothetical protein